MIKNLFIIIFLTVFLSCNTQNDDKIYSFMNNELPNHEFGKSSWGIFLLDKPVILDSNYCKKISQQKLNNIPKSIQQELYRNALALTYDWQQKFRWEQIKMKHDIIITDTKSKISFKQLRELKWAKTDTQLAKNWINEWNNSKVADRLINYSSVPVFSNDGNYVLILRGQDVESEGGWDTIYIYKKEKSKWVVLEKIIISTL